MSGPHDALVKAIFEIPIHMAGELRAVLPRKILAQLDLATLTLVPGSLLETSSLRARFTDLLFRVQKKNGKPAFIYVLVEHRSTPDPELLDRLLGYQVLIWQRWRAQGGRGPRPLILTVLIFQGPKKWRPPHEFAESYELEESEADLHGSGLNFPIYVDDLSRV